MRATRDLRVGTKRGIGSCRRPGTRRRRGLGPGSKYWRLGITLAGFATVVLLVFGCGGDGEAESPSAVEAAARPQPAEPPSECRDRRSRVLPLPGSLPPPERWQNSRLR